MNAARLAEQLRYARRLLLEAAAQVPSELVAVRPVDGEWSVIEVLAHLIDVDHHWLSQALAMRDTPGHRFVHFDDARWKEDHPQVREMRLSDIQARLNASHQAVLDALVEMTDEELARPGEHPRGIPYTVADVFRRYPDHDENHTRQIVTIRSALPGSLS